MQDSLLLDSESYVGHSDRLILSVALPFIGYGSVIECFIFS